MQGAKLFKELFEQYKDRKILLYGDPDCDGLMSLLLMCQFVEMFGLDYTYYVNEHRFHGFTLKPEQLEGYLVIASDFAILKEEMENLVLDHDIIVLSTDHHDVKEETLIDIQGKGRGIVLNNQYPFESEEDRYLSGAGVFYELITSLYPEFKSAEREALVGITLLSDIRPIENDKAKRYLRTTFKMDESTPYFKYLIEATTQVDYSFGAPKTDRNFIDYTLSPTINALLRYNKTSEAIDFILGRGLKSGSAYRTNQSELLAIMFKRARTLDLNNVVFVIVDAQSFADYPDVELSDFIGLLCSKVKDDHGGKSTMGISLKQGKVTRASFRGKYDDVHYLQGFKNLGLNANGHPNAFGFKDLTPDNDMWVQIDDMVGDLESGHAQTFKIIEVNNLAMNMHPTMRDIAQENCFVRDFCRTYIKYIGQGAHLTETTYKMEEYTLKDQMNGIEPDLVVKNKKMVYIRDSAGNPIPKYIEYTIDGRKVKSFGEKLEDSVILPILEKGFVHYYLKSIVE